MTTMKIIVVDDHPLFIDGLRQVLYRLHPQATVEQVYDVESALLSIEQEPDYDLALVDLTMPGLDGLDMLMLLAERKICLPTVLISAQENPKVIAQAIELGALGFIPKTYAADELLDAIRQVLNGDLFVPPRLSDQVKRLQRMGSHSRSVIEVGNDFGITPSQLRVLQLLAKGFSNRKIATALSLSEHTIKSHLKALFPILGADNRMDCVKKANDSGLLIRDFSLSEDDLSSS